MTSGTGSGASVIFVTQTQTAPDSAAAASSASAALASQTASSGSSSGKTAAIAVPSAVGGVIVLGLLLWAFLYCHRRRRASKAADDIKWPEVASSEGDRAALYPEPTHRAGGHGFGVQDDDMMSEAGGMSGGPGTAGLSHSQSMASYGQSPASFGHNGAQMAGIGAAAGAAGAAAGAGSSQNGHSDFSQHGQQPSWGNGAGYANGAGAYGNGYGNGNGAGYSSAAAYTKTAYSGGGPGSPDRSQLSDGGFNNGGYPTSSQGHSSPQGQASPYAGTGASGAGHHSPTEDLNEGAPHDIQYVPHGGTNLNRALSDASNFTAREESRRSGAWRLGVSNPDTEE